MGGIRPSPSRPFMRSSLTHRNELRFEMKPSGIAPQKKKLGAPSIAFFAMGGIRPSPSRPFMRSSLTHRNELRFEMNPSGIAPQKRSWLPHPSRFLRWVGYDQAHLACSSGAANEAPRQTSSEQAPSIAENYDVRVQNEGMHSSESRCHASNLRPNLSGMLPVRTPHLPPPYPPSERQY